MNQREELLAAIKATKFTEFVELVKLHVSKENYFSTNVLDHKQCSFDTRIYTPCY